MNAVTELHTPRWQAIYEACGISPVLGAVEEKSLADYVETHAHQLGSAIAVKIPTIITLMISSSRVNP